MTDEVKFDTLKIGTRYLIDCYSEWDSDDGTAVLDGFAVAKYKGVEEGCWHFEDYYGTELYFDMDTDDLRQVFPLPGSKGGEK